MPRTQVLSDLDVNRAKVTARDSLYSDFDLAFTPNPNTGDIGKLYDINSIKQSVKNLVLTSRGERPFNPLLGSDVRKLLFEPVDTFTAYDLRDAIITVLNNYEPRIRLIEVTVEGDIDSNRYHIDIEFQIRSSLAVGEVNFYLERIK